MGVGGSKKTKEAQILCVGLDGSGKTTIVKRLAEPEQQPDVVPTVGFQMETFRKGKTTFKVFDFSGGEKYRNLWEAMYGDAQGVIFCIDSNDRERMAEAKETLHSVLKNEQLLAKPVLFFANKKDLPSSMDMVDLHKALDLDALEGSWTIEQSCGLTGEGINEGIEWLSARVKLTKPKK